MTIADTFLDAAAAVQALLADERLAERWTAPSALPGYTVGTLVAHIDMATAFLRKLLDSEPPADLRPIPAVGYFAGMEGGHGQAHDYMRGMAEQAAARGAEANVAHFGAIVADLAKRLPDEDPARVLDVRPSLPFAIRLDDFTATRLVELVVHGDDLATSLGVAWQPGREEADLAVGLLVGTARARHGDLAVVRALARAERAEAGVFPVL